MTLATLDDNLDLALARFEAVSLEELVSTAELLERKDRKYLVPLADAGAALALLDTDSRVLDVASNRVFAYESVYFDTPDRTCYLMAAHGRRRRFKVRTRSYLDSGTTYLELKTNGRRGATIKERLEYDLEDRDGLSLEAGIYLARHLSQHGHDPDVVTYLVPSLVTRYQRSTVLLPRGGRVTVDTNLSWQTPDGDHFGLPGHVIIETKSAGLATGFDFRLWRLGYRPTHLSKFGTGMAVLDPRLPRSRWNRALREIEGTRSGWLVGNQEWAVTS